MLLLYNLATVCRIHPVRWSKLWLEFKDAHCLMHSEVLLLLQDLQERRREEAMTLPLPPPSRAFTDSMEYVKMFGQYTNRELIRAIRQYQVS